MPLPYTCEYVRSKLKSLNSPGQGSSAVTGFQSHFQIIHGVCPLNSQLNFCSRGTISFLLNCCCAWNVHLVAIEAYVAIRVTTQFNYEIKFVMVFWFDPKIHYQGITENSPWGKQTLTNALRNTGTTYYTYFGDMFYWISHNNLKLSLAAEVVPLNPFSGKGANSIQKPYFTLNLINLIAIHIVQFTSHGYVSTERFNIMCRIFFDGLGGDTDVLSNNVQGSFKYEGSTLPI